MTEDDIDESLTKLMTSLDKLEQRYKKEEQNMTQQTSRDAGSDDEPRDPQGRWTGGGGGEEVQHPDFMEGEEGNDIALDLETVPDEMHDSVDAVGTAREELDSASSEADDIAGEQDDVIEEYGDESKEYEDWAARSDAANENVANKTMAVHKALSDHIEMTMAHLNKLTGNINKYAKTNGVRGG